MNNKKNTKRALVSSVMALFLCFTMLLGTTYAWFTDSVTSANNIITTGNLNIELYHTDDKAKDEQVGETTKLFDDIALWEPGAVVYETFDVANKGSLALKYQLAVNVANAAKTAKGGTLADVLKVGVIKNGAVSETREGMVAEVTAWDSLASFTLPGDLLVGETDTYTVVIYWMPSDIDNDYNMKNGEKALTIEIGVNLYATQLANENDSFDNQFDADAWMDGMQVYSASDLQAAINAGESSIKLMSDIELTKAIVIPAAATTFATKAATPAVVIDLNGKTVSGAMADALVVNNGAAILTGGTLVNTMENGGAIIDNKGTMTLKNINVIGAPIAKDSGYPAYSITSTGNLTIEEGTNVVSDRGCLYLDGTGETVINGGTFTNNDIFDKIGGRALSTHVVAVRSSANNKLIVNNGTFNHNHTKTSGGVVICNMSAVTAEINGGKFTGGNYYGKWDNLSDWGYGKTKTPFVVTGGTFTGMDMTYVSTGFNAIANQDGTYTVLTDLYDSSVAPGVYLSEDGTVYGIFSEAGYMWVAAQEDAYFSSGARKTVKLEADIDFGGKTAPRIQIWNDGEGAIIFDGNGHTLSNFNVVDVGDNAGLFGGTLNIKNLNVENATATGNYVGILAGKLYGSIDNCVVKNSTVNGTFWQTGALVGQYNSGNVTNCTVDNCVINGMAAVGGLVGILNETAGERVIENCTVKNTKINQTGSFGGDYDNMFGLVTGQILCKATVKLNNLVFENNTVQGIATNNFLYGVRKEATVYLDGNPIDIVATTDRLIDAIKNAPVGTVTTIYLADRTFDGDIAITEAALGKSGGDVVIKAVDGAKPVITGNVTLGYRNQGVGATMYNANVTFEGITFDQAETGKHSITVMDVKSLTLNNCTIIGDGDHGIESVSGNDTGASKLVGCTLENASMQLYGNFAKNLVIDDCTFNESRLNVQGGDSVTVQNCKFNNTLKAANVGDSFYAIRSNSIPITVKNCVISIDSELEEVATSQPKWYLLANRGTTDWTVENVSVLLTEAALAQTELKVTDCTSTGKINTTNLTVNGVQK